MSHFTVAVITAKKEKLEEMLAPYDENLEVKPYIERTKKEIIKEIIKDINMITLIIGIVEVLIGAILIKITITISAMLLIIGGVNIGKRII